MAKIEVLIGMGIILVIGASVFAVMVQPKMEDLMPASIAQVVQENSLTIDNGSGSVQTLELIIKKGATAFGLLEKGTKKLQLELKTKTYEDMGMFIEAIGDKENGQEGKYWLYYVNAKMPSVAVDKQTLQKGDKVEFKFEESPF